VTRLHIDWTACDGRGLCAELLEEMLAEDDWGFPVSRDGAIEPVVPPHLANAAKWAVDRCPMLALKLVRR
jgi:ferredoxin